MNANKLYKLLAKAGKRAHLVGGLNAGVIVALDLEGRLFAVLDGEVLNRVNPEAVLGQSTREKCLNPGGDGLWPAPEGTSLGYQYATGRWCVPSSLIASRFQLTRAGAKNASIAAEIDLVNNQGLGVPTLFRRTISLSTSRNAVTVRVVESITCLGDRSLYTTDCLLAPWTLCQFDCGPGCETIFPCERKSSVWDLYESSDDQQTWDDGMCRIRTDGSKRYQIGIDAKTPWIEFRDPRRGLVVRRETARLPAGQSHVDLRNAPPDVSPSTKGICYSVYDDTSGFMEMEAAGGCPTVIEPNTEMSAIVSTRYQKQGREGR